MLLKVFIGGYLLLKQVAKRRLGPKIYYPNIGSNPLDLSGNLLKIHANSRYPEFYHFPEEEKII